MMSLTDFFISLDLTSKKYVDDLILNVQNQLDIINQTLPLLYQLFTLLSNQIVINTQNNLNLQLQITDINTNIGLIYQLLVLISNQIITNSQ